MCVRSRLVNDFGKGIVPTSCRVRQIYDRLYEWSNKHSKINVQLNEGLEVSPARGYWQFAASEIWPMSLKSCVVCQFHSLSIESAKKLDFNTV
jgi:hypothetical protein